MPDLEISGVVELGKMAFLDGFRIELTPTKHPRKFYLRITAKKSRGRAKHRRHYPRHLDNPEDTDKT